MLRKPPISKSILGPWFYWTRLVLNTMVGVFFLTVTGCLLSPSSGTANNLCSGIPPSAGAAKLNPGMYINKRVAGDTAALPLEVEVFHSNGIYYRRLREYSDTVTALQVTTVSEAWGRYLDSNGQIMGKGQGEYRNFALGDGWSQFLPGYGPAVGFIKANVTPNSFQRVGQSYSVNGEGERNGCTWEYETYTRIGGENDPWPLLVNWPEAWPDSAYPNLSILSESHGILGKIPD